jgi:hypothetical protein
MGCLAGGAWTGRLASCGDGHMPCPMAGALELSRAMACWRRQRLSPRCLLAWQRTPRQWQPYVPRPMLGHVRDDDNEL